MEDSNINSNDQFNDNPLFHQNHRSNSSRKRKHTQSHPNSTPISESASAITSSFDQLFWYDIRNLPDSLILEIIARLPVKSIFRFKCVCKYWQTLISHPSFCRFYSSISNSNCNSRSSLPFRIVYRYIYVSKFKEVLNRLRPEIYNSPKFSVLFLSTFEEQQQSDQFKILAISNGLILCCLLPLIYYVCDPITRTWVTLPRGRGSSSSHYPNFFGEGFVSRVNNQDNSLTSYVVVRVEFRSSTSTSNYLNLETFSSQTGEWVGYRIPTGIPIRLLKRGVGPIHFNGILHWFVHDHGMVAFDPYKDPKSCRIINFPKDRDVDSESIHEGIYRLCDECGGSLKFFEVSPNPSEFYCFRMWVMKDYEKGEWCLEFRVTRSDLGSSDLRLSGLLRETNFLPLSFHPLDSNVVYLRCIELGCIVSYHVKEKRLDVECKTIGVVEDLSWRVVVPFVLPRWPMPVPVLPVPKKSVKQRASHHYRSFRVHNR